MCLKLYRTDSFLQTHNRNFLRLMMNLGSLTYLVLLIDYPMLFIMKFRSDESIWDHIMKKLIHWHFWWHFWHFEIILTILTFEALLHVIMLKLFPEANMMSNVIWVSGKWSDVQFERNSSCSTTMLEAFHF